MCGLQVDVDDQHVKLIRGDRDDVWSKGYLCPKGTTLGHLHDDPDRLREPMVRDGDTWRVVTWDEAFARCEELIHGVLDRHGITSATAFVGNPQWVAEIFRPPDIQAVLYFAFIILTDPPTSPAKYPDQITCGVIVAVVSYAVFERFGVVYFLLAGVLVGNVWEAWRRFNRRAASTFPRGLSTFLRELSPL